MPTTPARITPGRKHSLLVGSFVRELEWDDVQPCDILEGGQKLYKCAMDGCEHVKKSKQ